MNSSIFCASRSWGAEYILYISPKHYTLKVLFVKAGTQGGLQKHHFKDEVGFILNGTLRVHRGQTLHNLSEYILSTGSMFSFPPGLIHQEEALTDTFIIETSSPHLNDRIRYDDDTFNTLPSTKPEDVFCLDDPEHIPAQLKQLGFTQTEFSSLPDQLKALISFYF